MIELEEIKGNNLRDINRAERIRQRTVYKFDQPRYHTYIQAITDADDWIGMVDCNGEVSERELKKTYLRVKKKSE